MLSIASPSSEIYGQGCLKSRRKLIFDPILCYHNNLEEDYHPRVQAVGFQNNGSKHCVKTKADKFMHHINCPKVRIV
jgi:hypothetical protein